MHNPQAAAAQAAEQKANTEQAGQEADQKTNQQPTNVGKSPYSSITDENLKFNPRGGDFLFRQPYEARIRAF